MGEIWCWRMYPPRERWETPTTSMPPVTRFPLDPRCLQVAGIGPDTVALGCMRGCQVIYAAVWLETEVVGPTHWNWVTHAGIGLYTWVLGCTQRRLARNGGGGPYTLALGLRCRCWLYAPAFSSWNMRSAGRNDNGGEKRSETHQIWALVPPISCHCIALGVTPGFRCRSSRLESMPFLVS